MRNQQRPTADWLAELGFAVGIVFVDIVGSTPLLHQTGTVAFGEILRAYRKRGRQLVAEHRGRLTAPNGDELFAAFPSTTNAFVFATQFFQDPGHPELASGGIRVGVHFGPVRADGFDELTGRNNVHLGHRVIENALTSEAWVSERGVSEENRRITIFAEVAHTATIFRYLS